MQCHVFIQEDGERCIFMAPAASSLIDKAAAREHFGMHDEFVLHIVTFYSVVQGFHFTFNDYINITHLDKSRWYQAVPK